MLRCVRRLARTFPARWPHRRLRAQPTSRMRSEVAVLAAALAPRFEFVASPALSRFPATRTTPRPPAPAALPPPQAPLLSTTIPPSTPPGARPPSPVAQHPRHQRHSIILVHHPPGVGHQLVELQQMGGGGGGRREEGQAVERTQHCCPSSCPAAPSSPSPPRLSTSSAKARLPTRGEP